jgi:hypothetical protein
MWRFIFCKKRATRYQMEQRTVVRVVTLKCLSAMEIEMEVTSTYCDEALQIFAVKKWRTRFMEGRTELEDDPRSGRHDSSD